MVIIDSPKDVPILERVNVISALVWHMDFGLSRFLTRPFGPRSRPESAKNYPAITPPCKNSHQNCFIASTSKENISIIKLPHI
jgi:hypothetical protein